MSQIRQPPFTASTGREQTVKCPVQQEKCCSYQIKWTLSSLVSHVSKAQVVQQMCIFFQAISKVGKPTLRYPNALSSDRAAFTDPWGVRTEHRLDVKALLWSRWRGDCTDLTKQICISSWELTSFLGLRESWHCCSDSHDYLRKINNFRAAFNERMQVKSARIHTVGKYYKLRNINGSWLIWISQVSATWATVNTIKSYHWIYKSTRDGKQQKTDT